MDKVDKITRSRIMGRVRSTGTRLERKFRGLLWLNNIRYRKNSKTLFGKPDIAIKNKKTAIFIDSCFWHGCPDHLRMPTDNKSYWINKIQRNINRDREVDAYYKMIKWNIIRIWEHELATDNILNSRIKEIVKIVKNV